MDVDYARVSTREQELDLQRDALEAAGVEKIYWEKVSSRKEDRPELAISHTGLAGAFYLPRCPLGPQVAALRFQRHLRRL